MNAPAPPGGGGGPARARPCPVCGRPAAAAAERPFCSRRCRAVDLNRWLQGAYAIPGRPPGDEDE